MIFSSIAVLRIKKAAKAALITQKNRRRGQSLTTAPRLLFFQRTVLHKRPVKALSPPKTPPAYLCPEIHEATVHYLPTEAIIIKLNAIIQ